MSREADLDNLYGVAITGMACRFPKADNPESFWRNICAGVDCVTRFSDEELLSAGLPPEIVHHPDYVKAGAILDQVSGFDAEFFNLSPAEAELADPQLRIFLECAWEALESAGCDPSDHDGAIGVFAGASLSSYLLYNLYPNLGFTPADSLPALLLNDKDYLATQTAYRFNLTGPAVTVQTACSTSLTAVYLACQSLLNGECDLALAGGVTVRVPQTRGYYYRRGGIASPDGLTRPFDADAQGTVFGNGAGVVVLRRLEDALNAGDRIDAIVLGGALNNDGAMKVGFSAPSVDGQAEVISESINIAGVASEDIGLVEAHGTATPLGDPIELAALNQAFRQTTEKKQFCAIGSVKSNVGHLESASGVAGLIKTAMALKRKKLPPTLNYRQPTAQFSFADSPFYVNVELKDWPADEAARRAGVSSFGIGGANVHLVLEEPPPEPAGSVAEDAARTLILPLSTRSPEALKELARRYLAFLETLDPERWSLRDICYSSSVRRVHHPVRLALSGRDRDEMRAQLRAFLADEPHEGMAAAEIQSLGEPNVVFVFPGQGAQWLGMGRRLWREEPAFREAVERCERAISPFVDWSLSEQWFADEQTSRLDEAIVAQPALFAFQVGLAALWAAYGVVPKAVVGHSMGEIAASYLAGALNLEEAARVVCLRTQLARRLKGEGAMALAALGEEQVERDLARHGGRLEIAAVNGPAATLVSGEPEALEEALADWRGRDIFCRRVNVDYASHCSQMDPLLPELRDLLDGLKPKPATMPMMSTVYGRQVSGPELDGEYWAANLRQRVLLLPTVSKLLEQGMNLFVEISPHPTLAPSIRETIRVSGHAAETLASVQRDRDERLAFLESFASLYCMGYPVAWRSLYPRPGRFVRLPSYPWQRREYWIGGQGVGYDLHMKRSAVLTSGDEDVHPLLGSCVVSSLQKGVRFWQAAIDRQSRLAAYLSRYGDTLTVDGMAFVALARAATRIYRPALGTVFRRLRFPAPLFLAGPDHREIMQLSLSMIDDDWGSVRAASAENGSASGEMGWRRHLDAEIAFDEPTALDCAKEEPQAMADRLAQRLDGEAFYGELSEHGVFLDQSARAVTRLCRNLDEGLAELATPDGAAVGEDLAASLQACAHVVAVLAMGESKAFAGAVCAPAVAKTVVFSKREARPAWIHARLGLVSQKQGQLSKIESDVNIYDQNGRALVTIKGLELRPLGRSIHLALLNLSEWRRRVDWEPAEAPYDPGDEAAKAGGLWLIFANRGSLCRRIVKTLRAFAPDNALVQPGEGFRRIDDRHFEVNAAEPGDFERLFDDLAETGASPRRILYLWGIAAEPCDTTDELRARLALGSGGLLHMTQAFVRREQDPLPRLWLVVAGLHRLPGDDFTVDAGQAPVWGVGMNIVQEHPELKCTMADLSPDPGAEELDALCQEAVSNLRANQIALRGRRRFVAKLARSGFDSRLSLGSAEKPLFREDALYLVSGGTGGIGLALASWLADQGARHLALFSRNKPDDRAQVALDELAARVSQLALFQTDVADESALAAMLRCLEQSMPPLAGVFHLAAVMEDNVLLLLDWARFQKAAKPKVEGAWNLHRLTRERDLDYFVTFSSIVSILGSHGQSGYTAGNRFLDALAHHRRALGLPALSVNWGSWAEVGRAADVTDAGLNQRLAGLERFSPEWGFEALRRLLREDEVQAGFAPGLDLALWFQRHPHSLALPYFSGEAPVGRAENGPRVGCVREELQSVATPSAKRALLASFLRRAAGAALKLPPARVESDKPLASYGLNSLLGIDFRRAVEEGLGLEFSPTVIYNYPTIQSLSQFLADKLALDAEVATTADSPGDGGRKADDFADLSEEEAEALLLEKLNAVEKSG